MVERAEWAHFILYQVPGEPGEPTLVVVGILRCALFCFILASVFVTACGRRRVVNPRSGSYWRLIMYARVYLEGPAPGVIRSGWDQSVKREQ